MVKKEFWVMMGVVVLLLGAAFVVGLVLVKPSEKSLVESLPVVDEAVLFTIQTDL